MYNDNICSQFLWVSCFTHKNRLVVLTVLYLWFCNCQKFTSLHNNKAIVCNEGRIKLFSTTFKLLIRNFTHTHTHQKLETGIQQPILRKW